MRRRLAREEGFSIAIAMVLMSMMLSVGLVSFAYVDTEQDQSRVERVDESAFNLGEGALNAQAFVLSRHWPGTSSRAYVDCTQASAGIEDCPQADALAASFDSVDYQQGAPTWTTTVRDDDGTEFYDEDQVTSQPAYDANGNGEVWVRSEATYTVGPDAGRSRAMVAKVAVETIDLNELPAGQSFPERTIVAGKFATGNNGNKVIVETGAPSSPHPVTVRCVDLTSPSCLNYRRNAQISPESVEGGQYVGVPVIAPDIQRALKEKAQADGTYYTGNTCPSLTGDVIWVVSASCTYSGSTEYNSAADPGIVVFESGSLELSGTTSFHGIIYMLNTLNRTDMDFLKLQGNTEVHGRVFVDGNAGVQVGQSKKNLIYDDFKGIVTPGGDPAFAIYGTAAIVQNSWRELDG